MSFPDRILIAATACLFLLGPMSGFGQEEKDEDGLPARLTWRNGESLPGEMVGANESELIWKSPLFAKPVPLSLSELRSVTSEADAARPDGSMALNLRDGSRIYGDLTGFEGEWLSMASKRHGIMRIRTSEIMSIHRLEGGDILWCGPFGEAGWKYPGPKVGPGRRLRSAEGGALETVAWRQRVTVPLELPEKVEIEFRLSAPAQPEFELEAVAGKRKITLTTWKDELVLRRGSHFVSVGVLKPEDREVNLHLFWDRIEGSGMISSPEGKLLAKWESSAEDDEPPAAAPPKPAAAANVRIEVQAGMINRIAAAVFPGLGPGAPAGSAGKSKDPAVDGVAVVNRGAGMRLEFLRVRKWDGVLPEGVMSNPFRTRLELSGSPAIEGNIVGGTAESLVFRLDGETERTIPVEKIESFYFPAVAAEEKDGDRPKPDEFRFTDGTWLRGRLLGIEDGSARIESPFSEDPVAAKLTGLRELRIFSAAPPEGEEGKEPVPLAKQDKLVTGETTIHGSWHPAGGDRIQWRLAGASEPVEIASDAAMELSRVPPEDGDWPRSPALFHLSNGQVAPGELVAIHGGKEVSVEYRSELFEPGAFSADDLHAIQFRGPDINPEGFEDPGWQIVRGEKKTVTVKDGMVTMEPGGTWGHPSILMGDEIRFTIQPSGYGTLRVRMFTEGVSATSLSTNILLAHYGNEIYCGLEETPGQLNQRRDVAVGNNKPAKVRLNWDGTSTRVYVNETMAIRIPNDKKARRSGLGLILEPANLWGNGERQMKVSDFSLRAAPGLAWVPGVNAVAKERALFLPRFRKEDPPQHILLAPNGDVLRGSIVAAAGERFAFRSGLEELSIPKDRVVAAIWLKPAKSDDDEEKEEEAGESAEAEPEAEPEVEKGEKADSEGPEPTHWLLLTSGARLGLAIEDFGPGFVTGDSPFLGKCRIPAEHIHLIRSTKPEISPATQAFANWQLEKAPEPLAEGGGDNSPMIGNAAPEIDLALLEGGRFRLSEEKGKIVVLDFWATWCGPCVRAIPEMIEEFSSFDRNRVRFIGVNQAEAPGLIDPFIQQRGWNPFEVALDVETVAGQAYGVEGIPHTVIVDHDGKVAWVSIGFKPDSAAEAARVVRELLGEAPDDRTAQIMEAEDIEDLDLKPPRFDEFMASFLADLVRNDREKALEVFEKAVEIVETSRERDKWKMKYGDVSRSFVCDTVMHLRERTDGMSWLAFQADLIRSKKVPPFELPRSWGELRVVEALTARDEKTGKPGQPLEASIKALAEAVRNPELYPFAAPYLLKTLQFYDVDTVSHLQATLDSADGELSPFLKELQVALEMQLQMRENYRGRGISEKAEAHYLAALKDESVPVAVREFLASFLVSDAAPLPSGDMILASADVVAKAWKGDTPVFQVWSRRVLEAFIREERNATWKQVATRLGDGFRARYLPESDVVGIPNVPDDDLVSLMMDVFISTGKPDTAKVVFERFENRFVDFEAPMLQFIRSGEFDEALKILKEKSGTIGSKEISHAAYDELLDKNAPAFLEKVDRSGLRALVEAVIANASDPLSPGFKQRVFLKHGSPRSLRLQAAAENFADASFSKKPMKLQVLGILANDVAAARIVAEPLRDAAEEIDVDAAIDSKILSTKIRDWQIQKPDLAIVKGALLLNAAEGEIEKVNAQLDWIAGADVREPNRKKEFAEWIVDLPARAILGSAEPKKTAEAIIPVCQRLALGIEGLEVRSNRVDKKRTTWAQLTFAMAEAGKMNEFGPWLLENGGEGKQYNDRFGMWKNSPILYFRILAEKFDGAPVEERVAFLNELLGQEWVVESWNSFANGGFRNSCGKNVITPEELFEHGEAMAKASPRKGHGWSDLAFVFASNGRLDDAARFWGEAVKERKADEDERDGFRYRAHHARAVFQQQRLEEAAKLIEDIDPEDYEGVDFVKLSERITAGEALVPGLEAWQQIAAESSAGAPPMGAKERIKPAPEKPAADDEPDPFSASTMKKGEAPGSQPDTAPAKTQAEMDGDEPDPFAAPGKKEKPAGEKAEMGGDDGGNEPDPFGQKPKKAPEEKAKPELGGAEPDPFAQ